jgi:myosin heavy subunit
MMGVDGPQLYMNFLKPRIKVGNEFVTQGRNVNQVKKFLNSISFIKKEKINEN